jgi:hypothetical protein
MIGIRNDGLPCIVVYNCYTMESVITSAIRKVMKSGKLSEK